MTQVPPRYGALPEPVTKCGVQITEPAGAPSHPALWGSTLGLLGQLLC